MIRNLQRREAEGPGFVQPEQGKAEGGTTDGLNECMVRRWSWIILGVNGQEAMVINYVRKNSS